MVVVDNHAILTFHVIRLPGSPVAVTTGHSGAGVRPEPLSLSHDVLGPQPHVSSRVMQRQSLHVHVLLEGARFGEIAAQSLARRFRFLPRLEFVYERVAELTSRGETSVTF